jgi:hypothetical protein
MREAEAQVLAAYWDEMRGMLIPRTIAAGIERADRSGGPLTVVTWLQRYRTRILVPEVPVSTSPQIRLDARAEILQLAAEQSLTDEQAAVAEFLCDLLLVERWCMEDLLAATASASKGGTVGDFLLREDAKGSLLFPQAIKLVLQPCIYVGPDDAVIRPAVETFLKHRRPWPLIGVVIAD